jgi:hypothetical protein
LVLSEHTPKTQTALRADIEEAVSSIAWADPIYVPHDPHLFEASVLDLDQLQHPAQRAYLEAAARLSEFYGAPPVPLYHQVGGWGR